MYNIGVVPGKFFPPHRGHLNQIIRAATQCKKVYVVVSDDEDIAMEKCRKDRLKYMPIKLRALWLSIELQSIDHIKVVILDETGIPPYPDGSIQWCKMLTDLIPESIDVIFGGEKEYQDTYMKHLPGIEYNVYDYKRSRYPISATEVRHNYLKHWDYILGSARPFFARRVLITGTESCAKSTLTKYLGKIFHTSWSEEYGRYYSEKFLGGNENLFRMSDFEKIARHQAGQDSHALKTANKIAFFDTDATVTQYYCEMYMGQKNMQIERLVNPQKYDVVLLMGPNVKWVYDGLRFKDKQTERIKLHRKLYYMYRNRGFKNIIEINDSDYYTRLEKAVEIADKLIADPNYMNRY